MLTTHPPHSATHARAESAGRPGSKGPASASRTRTESAGSAPKRRRATTVSSVGVASAGAYTGAIASAGGVAALRGESAAEDTDEASADSRPLSSSSSMDSHAEGDAGAGTGKKSNASAMAPASSSSSTSSAVAASLPVQPGSVSSAHHRRAPRYHGASSHSYNLLPALGETAQKTDANGRREEGASTEEGSAQPSGKGSSEDPSRRQSFAVRGDVYSRFPSPEPDANGAYPSAGQHSMPFTAEQANAAFAGFSPDYGTNMLPSSTSAADVELAKVRWALHLQPVITFHTSLNADVLVKEVASRLPAYSEAERAFRVYRANVSWMYDVIDDWQGFEREHIAAFYPGAHASTGAPPSASADARHPHALALIFMILSLGTMFDVQRTRADGKPESYFRSAWKLLSLSNAQDQYTIESVQAYHLIGQYLSNRRSGKGADSFMAVLGLTCRHAMSMGLHRDTSDWKEGENAAEAEERRRLFWDLMATDAFRALAWGQPPNLNVEIVTTRFAKAQNGEKEDFHTAKWRIISVLNRILWTCFHLPSVSYDTVLRFDAELRELQRTLLPRLEPNSRDLRGVDLDKASELLREEDEPAIKLMRQELQSRTLAANIEQVLLHLHRPWLLRALQGKVDPAKSPFSHSVLSVQQSSRTLVKICAAVSHRVPRLQVKWVFWAQHSFNAAICQALQVCSAPRSVLVSSVMQDLEEAVAVLDAMRPELDPQTWERRLQLLDTQLDRARMARIHGGAGKSAAKASRRTNTAEAVKSTKELGSLVGAVPRYSTGGSTTATRRGRSATSCETSRTGSAASAPSSSLPPPPPPLLPPTMSSPSIYTQNLSGGTLPPLPGSSPSMLYNSFGGMLPLPPLAATGATPPPSSSALSNPMSSGGGALSSTLSLGGPPSPFSSIVGGRHGSIGSLSGFPTMHNSAHAPFPGASSGGGMEDLAVFAPSDRNQQNALLSGILGEETFESDSGFWMSLLGLSSELH